MIQFIMKLGTDVLAIEVPKDFCEPELIYNYQSELVLKYRPDKFLKTIIFHKPPGQWQYLGTTETITEDQAAELIDIPCDMDCVPYEAQEASLTEFAKWLDEQRNLGSKGQGLWRDMSIWGKENACQIMLEKYEQTLLTTKQDQ